MSPQHPDVLPDRCDGLRVHTEPVGDILLHQDELPVPLPLLPLPEEELGALVVGGGAGAEEGADHLAHLRADSGEGASVAKFAAAAAGGGLEGCDHIVKLGLRGLQVVPQAELRHLSHPRHKRRHVGECLIRPLPQKIVAPASLVPPELGRALADPDDRGGKVEQVCGAAGGRVKG